MKTKHLIVFAFMTGLTIISCTQKEAHTKPLETTEIAKEKSISEQLMLLNDSANNQWNRMMQADSQKFADVKRLIEEISYCKKYDEKAVESLLKFRNEVYAIRYTQETLSDSLIDLYDSKTTELINKVRNLKGKTPEITQHPLADQLENEIMKADTEDLVLLRKNYDQIANAFNNLLDANKDVMEKDPSLKNLKKKKVFSVVI